MKKVAVIGGGFTGLACAARLTRQGFQTKIFEAGNQVGGLAGGFNLRGRSWKWKLEVFYHHIFTNDRDILRLAKLVDCPVQIKNPVTSSFTLGREIRLDSPMSLLGFAGISLAERLWMGLGLAVLKIIPNGQYLEKYRVVDFLPKLLGRGGYEAVWKKLLVAKFGPFVNQVNMAWFWSRVNKRTKKLGYFEGGFAGLAEKMVAYIEKKGGEVRLNSGVRSLDYARDDKGGVWVDGERFDAVVMTVPAPYIKKLVPQIDFPKINYLWGQTLVLECSEKLIQSYWLNILEDDWPFLVMVNHTNFIDKKNYGGNQIIYLGNYLPEGHQQLQMSKEELWNLYSPFIKKIDKSFDKKRVKNLFLFRSPYAQPVFPVNYSSKLPHPRTSVKGVYLANMSMVYPFDRGTNYAVKMGGDVAEMVIKDLKNT